MLSLVRPGSRRFQEGRRERWPALHGIGLPRPGSCGELDMAIGDFTQEMALNPLGSARLAEAYCIRGSSNHKKKKKYDAAIGDYKEAIEIGITADGCSCDPFNPLVTLYDG
jgi:hypothetical protein